MHFDKLEKILLLISSVVSFYLSNYGTTCMVILCTFSSVIFTNAFCDFKKGNKSQYSGISFSSVQYITINL